MATHKVEELRNVSLIAHSSAGKTSLAEAMLFNSGALSRLGTVQDGNTVSDYDPEEVRRQISVSTLRKARTELGVQARKCSFDGGTWYLSLPIEGAPQPNPEREGGLGRLRDSELSIEGAQGAKGARPEDPKAPITKPTSGGEKHEGAKGAPNFATGGNNGEVVRELWRA